MSDDNQLCPYLCQIAKYPRFSPIMTNVRIDPNMHKNLASNTRASPTVRTFLKLASQTHLTESPEDSIPKFTLMPNPIHGLSAYIQAVCGVNGRSRDFTISKLAGSQNTVLAFGCSNKRIGRRPVEKKIPGRGTHGELNRGH